MDHFYSEKDLIREFPNEHNLLKNNLSNLSENKSVLHFSVNKAATQYVKSILVKIGLHKYAFYSKMPYLSSLKADEMINYHKLFKKHGIIYSVFGGYIENIPDFDAYNVIFTVRDPRDILVSEYYSIAYSHPLPPENSNKREAFINRREKAKSVDVDQYVIDNVRRVKSVFLNYYSNYIRNYNNVFILKYETLVEDFELWLKYLGEGVQLNISPQLKSRFIKYHEKSRIKTENKNVHRRKGIAGDYKVKLCPSTISIINDELLEVLKAFDYVI
jgi:hypothetical protein